MSNATSLDTAGAWEVLPVDLPPHVLLETPLLNKGSAFTAEERKELGLLGLLPPHVSTLEEQLARTYENYRRKESDLERYVFLASLQDRNEVLFFRLLQEHIQEMAPVIYTPVVGLACQSYSHIYRRPRGLYLAYPHRADLERILEEVAAEREIAIIVVTDGERILGLGDLGVGGMGIPVGKLALYTLCAGIHPAHTLPIVLDVGTDNAALLADPLYLGWRHERVRGAEYDAFIEQFVHAVERAFPRAVLQWEDFAKANARRLLERYRRQLCSFNDDIQGTGAVTLAGLLAAVDRTGSRLADQRVVVLGAGSAATGICEQVVAALQDDGLSREMAQAALWLTDTRGLVHTGRTDLDAGKRMFAQPVDRLAAWSAPLGDRISLAEVVRHVHPTILIGTAAQPHAFDEALIREMARHVAQPIIFPLSNPTDKSEATPDELLAWTDGRALVATGSPFGDVHLNREVVRIGQCNNMFIFPGVGLGTIISGAHQVTDSMFLAAARALSACAQGSAPGNGSTVGSLYPPVDTVREVSRGVALAVAVEAGRAGVAEPRTADDLARRIDARVWQPHYVRLTRARPHSVASAE